MFCRKVTVGAVKQLVNSSGGDRMPKTANKSSLAASAKTKRGKLLYFAWVGLKRPLGRSRNFKSIT
jgi:hypothetical protein